MLDRRRLKAHGFLKKYFVFVLLKSRDSIRFLNMYVCQVHTSIYCTIPHNSHTDILLVIKLSRSHRKFIQQTKSPYVRQFPIDVQAETGFLSTFIFFLTDRNLGEKNMICCKRIFFSVERSRVSHNCSTRHFRPRVLTILCIKIISDKSDDNSLEIMKTSIQKSIFNKKVSHTKVTKKNVGDQNYFDLLFSLFSNIGF